MAWSRITRESVSKSLRARITVANGGPSKKELLSGLWVTPHRAPRSASDPPALCEVATAAREAERRCSRPKGVPGKEKVLGFKVLGRRVQGFLYGFGALRARGSGGGLDFRV